MRKIIIEDYNPEWPEEFDELKAVYMNSMKHLNIDVQHVGSTSIPGCAAKPILDIDIIIDGLEKLTSVIDILDKLGYTHQGDLGIEGREAFKRASSKVPYHNNKNYKFAHNLYVCVAGTVSLENHLRFRDYLRDNIEAVHEYNALKKELASKYEHDIDSYIEKKTTFITRILSITGLKQSQLIEIASQNKK